MIQITVQTLLIIALVSMMIGMIVGVSLVRPTRR